MAGDVKYEHILDNQHLKDFIQSIAKHNVVGFDTEFVSENRYRPELCLIQVAAGDQLAIIDSLKVTDLMPFWDYLCEDGRVTIAHAAREEFLFCFRDSGNRPAQLFDLQIAAGMIGFEYPAAYGTLVSRICGVQLDKGETRTDWSKRPLTDKQIKYALSDVLHLEHLYNEINSKLRELNRDDWYWNEVNSWLGFLEKQETEPQWRRVSGTSGLSRKSLAIVREVFIWRNREAKSKNRSPKRILPDDLIAEIAKRGVSNVDNLESIRGFDRRVSKHYYNEIRQAVIAANNLDEKDLPKKPQSQRTQNLGLLGQFVATTLNLVCRDAAIAHNLVGTASDVRELAAWKLGLLKKSDSPPKLLTGWRKQFVEEWIDEVLAGKVSLRVGNPKSDQPLVLTRD